MKESNKSVILQHHSLGPYGPAVHASDCPKRKRSKPVPAQKHKIRAPTKHDILPYYGTCLRSPAKKTVALGETTSALRKRYDRILDGTTARYGRKLAAPPDLSRTPPQTASRGRRASYSTRSSHRRQSPAAPAQTAAPASPCPSRTGSPALSSTLTSTAR